jgi:hypothetical protein
MDSFRLYASTDGHAHAHARSSHMLEARRAASESHIDPRANGAAHGARKGGLHSEADLPRAS